MKSIPQRCDEVTAAGDRCSRRATWVKRPGLRGGRVEWFCTRHANLVVNEPGRRKRPKTWRALA